LSAYLRYSPTTFRQCTQNVVSPSIVLPGIPLTRGKFDLVLQNNDLGVRSSASEGPIARAQTGDRVGLPATTLHKLRNSDIRVAAAYYPHSPTMQDFTCTLFSHYTESANPCRYVIGCDLAMAFPTEGEATVQLDKRLRQSVDRFKTLRHVYSRLDGQFCHSYFSSRAN